MTTYSVGATSERVPCTFGPSEFDAVMQNLVRGGGGKGGVSSLNPAELQVLRAQFEKEGDMVGVQTKFNFAWGLVKSSARADQQQGVMLLTEIFRTSPERRRECLYYLALGNYKLGNYAEARRYNDLLLEKEPTNQQASNLNTLIDDKVQKEGLVGVAIVSGIAVVAGVVGGVLLRNIGRRR
ncbi:mitochondria fission 1 protein [Sporothrix brasiliensis 5110]|uniref:Mitochondrial fission 1 protein n=1 Tax=Sporothrix brasiliensis 5110 TaxID=1398154 RepID=A0A0C2J6Z4_9PEZI|nr:mitochondria fission 1 protein [Sporothrix brasiliensis 5110]KIH94760.1 mitochondria fission 1 protein [Sporothrix brasiliensis 5110]